MTARILQFVSIAVSAACLGVLAQDLVLRRAGDELRVAAPRLHFLTGKPLERMRNGAAVTFDMQVTILPDNRQVILRRGFERFVISYDLWEEKFSVTRVRSARATASHLTAEAAESVVPGPYRGPGHRALDGSSCVCEIGCSRGGAEGLATLRG